MVLLFAYLLLWAEALELCTQKVRKVTHFFANMQEKSVDCKRGGVFLGLETKDFENGDKKSRH